MDDPGPRFGLVSVCGLLTELEDVGRVVALAGYGQEARRLPFLCRSLAHDDELLCATRDAVYGSVYGRRTRLMSASRAGDVRRVRVLLRARGVDVDAEDAKGCTALHHASAAGQAESVRLLLDGGADKDRENTVTWRHVDEAARWRPLHYACAAGHESVARLLLQRGARTGKVDSDGDWTDQPLHVACARGHVDVVRLLLAAGADQDARGHSGYSPYHLAIQHGHEAVVSLLLDRDVNRMVHAGSPQLLWAVSCGQESVARLLLDRGADVNARGHGGTTALHGAAEKGSVALTRLLLDRGADVNAQSSTGCTPASCTSMAPLRPSVSASAACFRSGSISPVSLVR